MDIKIIHTKAHSKCLIKCEHSEEFGGIIKTDPNRISRDVKYIFKIKNMPSEI